MKLINYIPVVLLTASLSGVFTACQDYLDAKPSEALVVPQSLAELQAILDNHRDMNGGVAFWGLTPSMGENACDDYYVNDLRSFNLLPALTRGLYTWEEQVTTEGEEVLDWNLAYRAVFYANAVLDGLDRLRPATSEQGVYNNLKGMALFHRAHMFYQLLQVFAKPYQQEHAGSDMGIPLRLQADVNEKLSRASVEASYQQVLQDLKTAVPLLHPIQEFKTRPSKPAAYALMARTLLSMRLYDEALPYADSALQLSNKLLDFNAYTGLSATAFLLPRFNTEVLFHCNMQSRNGTPVSYSRVSVDTLLYRSYADQDLRKTIYFRTATSNRPGYIFRGSYDGTQEYFTGIATDEVYLMKAECLARKGLTADALSTLNVLLSHRYAQGHFEPYEGLNPDAALTLILQERRKELQRRGLRWMDLRRLNQEPAYARTLSRNIEGVLYTLPPSDKRYVFPIPANVMGFNPGMLQNER